ncbi:MAG: alanine--tRNA ligase [Candidatus Melainabacteria bacterium]|nr:alanine--tRNA ligase [Candidatus Melainabacteria bacterium]
MVRSGAEIRSEFISFFRDKKGHLHLPSSSLIPDNPTLLLTSAGMVQFVPIFLGNAPATDPPRAVTVQKCARAGGKDSDIENIGRTTRHHSFFEMLGNFSFGDYFKRQIIPWAWEFVTEHLKLDPKRLIVTVFEGDEEMGIGPDEEAYEIWHKVVGVPAERIFKMSKKDNFWGPPGPTGPCGPCSEIYIDRGPEFSTIKNADPDKVDFEDGNRFMEIWNLVFMEFFKDEHGKFTPLEKKNVDTGAGLERISMVLQGKKNTFETDLFQPILDEVCKLSKVKYSGTTWNETTPEKERPLPEKQDTYLKIICDHARCVSFLIADGVRTSNVGRGYVLRFLTRRAARFGRLLGMNEPFIHKLVATIATVYGEAYPEIKNNQAQIAQVILDEENKFAKTIDRGMSILEELLEKKESQLPGEVVFNLYATYGFPLELTSEIASEHEKSVDLEGFARAREEHEKVSSVSKFNVIMTGDEALGNILKKHGTTSFTGYKGLVGESSVLAILKDSKMVDHAEEGEEVDIILNATPFYAESGGQLGDKGLLFNNDASIQVMDTKKSEGLHIHRCRVLGGSVRLDDKFETKVDIENRESTVLHHSSAHLFHAAVRQLLGKHVMQAGSQVGPNAMRFDFSFERQPTKQELFKIESLMNEWVRSNTRTETQEMSLAEAKQTGAIAMFGEKYGDVVRVVKMGDFSLEFCGGTHVNSTGDISMIKIVSEGSIASGVRRVEALAGKKAWDHISKQIETLGEISDKLKVKPAEIGSQIEKLQSDLKARDKQNEALQEKLMSYKARELKEKAQQVGQFKLVSATLNDGGYTPDQLKLLASIIKDSGDNYITALASSTGPNQVSLVMGASAASVKAGIHAGNLVKEMAQIVGGSGGGRPDLAQAGGKDPSRINEALEKVKEVVSLK